MHLLQVNQPTKTTEFMLDNGITERQKYIEQKKNSSKLDCDSLKESKGAIVETKPGKHAVKHNEERDLKKFRMMYKRH